MKKFLLIGTAIVAVAILALGVVGYAYAQTPVPPTTPYGPGMGGRGGGMMGGGMRGGMMGGQYAAGETGPMHDYMLKTFAEALDMTPEALQAELDGGKTMWQVAQEKGLTTEQIQALMTEARAAALKQMVADGTITQEQADWMLSRGAGGMRGGANGGCPMQNGSGVGGQRGPGRWNSNPAQPQS